MKAKIKNNDGSTDAKLNHQDTQTPRQHTPGPWTVGAHVENDWEPNHFIIQRGKGEIAHVYFGQAEEQAANARLIAAAPDLLAACEIALQRIGDKNCQSVVESKLRAAIAGAKGGIAKI